MTTPNPSAATTGTVTLHRVLRAPAERIYRAFLDADALCKWLPPHGFTGRVLSLDARVGGSYRMQFTNLSSGGTHAFGGEYVELVPGERIVHTDRFDDPNLPRWSCPAIFQNPGPLILRAGFTPLSFPRKRGRPATDCAGSGSLQASCCLFRPMRCCSPAYPGTRS